VKLTPTQIEYVKSIGGGKLNTGISLLVDNAMSRRQQ